MISKPSSLSELHAVASIGGKHMQVRVEVGQIPERLHEQDQPGAGTRGRLGVRIDK